MDQELRNIIHTYCTDQKDFFELETYAASMQGKGWGTATMSAEVDSCASLVEGVPNVFVDIGGNKGLYTEEVLKRFPETECHIFEPSSVNVQILKAKFDSLPNVTVNGKALSNREDTLTLYSNEPGSGLASLTKRNIDHVNIKMNLEETVEVIRFDSYWDDRYIDYVKIDVEGHELDVLDGFGALISKTKIIQFEFGGCNIDTKSHYRDFWYYFKNRGFAVYRITPFGPSKLDTYTEYDEHYKTTNFIAVNELMGIE